MYKEVQSLFCLLHANKLGCIIRGKDTSYLFIYSFNENISSWISICAKFLHIIIIIFFFPFRPFGLLNMEAYFLSLDVFAALRLFALFFLLLVVFALFLYALSLHLGLSDPFSFSLYVEFFMFSFLGLFLSLQLPMF